MWGLQDGYTNTDEMMPAGSTVLFSCGDELAPTILTLPQMDTSEQLSCQRQMILTEAACGLNWTASVELTSLSNGISEITTTDNIVTLTLPVACSEPEPEPTPDSPLELSSFSVSLKEPYVGQEIKLRIIVVNTGDQTYFSVPVTLAIPDLGIVQTITVNRLPKGQAKAFDIYFTPESAGDFTGTVSINTSDLTWEHEFQMTIN